MSNWCDSMMTWTHLKSQDIKRKLLKQSTNKILSIFGGHYTLGVFVVFTLNVANSCLQSKFLSLRNFLKHCKKVNVEYRYVDKSHLFVFYSLLPYAFVRKLQAVIVWYLVFLSIHLFLCKHTSLCHVIKIRLKLI